MMWPLQNRRIPKSYALYGRALSKPISGKYWNMYILIYQENICLFTSIVKIDRCFRFGQCWCLSIVWYAYENILHYCKTCQSRHYIKLYYCGIHTYNVYMYLLKVWQAKYICIKLEHNITYKITCASAGVFANALWVVKYQRLLHADIEDSV